MTLISVTMAFYFLFGSFAVLGGVIGFIKAKSRASLIAGCVSGALLDFAGILLLFATYRPYIGLGLGIFVTLALLGKFAPAFFRTKKFMPAGIMLLLGLISLILSGLALGGSASFPLSP